MDDEATLGLVPYHTRPWNEETSKFLEKAFSARKYAANRLRYVEVMIGGGRLDGEGSRGYRLSQFLKGGHGCLVVMGAVC
jgi:hypothetical protein